VVGWSRDRASANVSGEPPTHRAAVAEHIRVMTYNLHGGQGGPDQTGGSQDKLDSLAAAIRREHPDVVVMQEVDWDADRSGFLDTLDGLARRLHPSSNVEASPGANATGRHQSVAVMTFGAFRIANARNIEHGDGLSAGIGRRSRAFMHVSGTPAYVPRNTIDTIVTTPAGNDVRVLGGHYGWPSAGSGNEQQVQDVPLAAALAAWRGPTLLGGDFNVSSQDRAHYTTEATAMGHAGLTDTFTDAGIGPADKRRASLSGGGAIDRIYTSTQFHVDHVRVARDAGWASDHQPVVADLTLEPPTVAGDQTDTR
jgi:endonuclease/exonuclease/phosphatase family metal-dependent hydrolase